MSKALDEQIRAALLARKGEWASISDGASVSYSWLSKFANGHIDNPGYRTLKRLELFIKGKPSAMSAKRSRKTAEVA